MDSKSIESRIRDIIGFWYNSDNVIVGMGNTKISDLNEMPERFIYKDITDTTCEMTVYNKINNCTLHEPYNYTELHITMPPNYMTSDKNHNEYAGKHKEIWVGYDTSTETLCYDNIANEIIDRRIDIFNDIPMIHRLTDIIMDDVYTRITMKQNALNRFIPINRTKSAKH